MAKKVVITFGRFNPPTRGHENVFKKMKEVAAKEKADMRIYVSHSQDEKRNPLHYPEKLKYIKLSYPEYAKNVIESQKHTIFDILRDLENKYKTVFLVVGEDRVKDFEKAVKPYVNADHPDALKLHNFNVISADDRDISASIVRDFVKDNNYEEFKKGVSQKLTDRQANQLFQTLRKRMGLEQDINNTLKEMNNMDKEAQERQLKKWKTFKEFYIKMMDEEADKNQPDSDFLVVDKNTKARHLPVKRNGKEDPNLMGAAHAAKA